MLRQHVKSYIRQIVACICYVSKINLVQHKGKVMILMYHRIMSKKELDLCLVQPGMYVRDDVFGKQIAFLKRRYQIISFNCFLDAHKAGKLDKNKRYCIITFDDGWMDNYLYAFPILKKLKVPATIFLPTSYIGTSKWFWNDKIAYLLDCRNVSMITEKEKKQVALLFSKFVKMDKNIATMLDFHMVREKQIEMIDEIIERLKVLPQSTIDELICKLSEIIGNNDHGERIFLNWEEIAEMSRHDISFGSHSCSHRLLDMLSMDEIKNEAEDSMHILKEKKVNTVPIFCYPNGNYTQVVVDHVKACGYQAAVTTHSGLEACSPQDMFKLRRIAIHNDVSSTIPLFSLRLSTFL